MNVILASNSPRRRELLAQHGVAFSVKVPDADERLTDEQMRDPVHAAQELALAKASAVAATLGAADAACDEGAGEAASCDEAATCEGTIVIGADTMVVLDGRIFGKPAGRADAHRMIAALAGRTHQVVTGVALLSTCELDACDPAARPDDPGVLRSVTCPVDGWHAQVLASTSDVTFKPLDDAQIESYLDVGEYTDKAGAYAIQGAGAELVSHYEGELDNIIGLPAERLLRSVAL